MPDEWDKTAFWRLRAMLEASEIRHGMRVLAEGMFSSLLVLLVYVGLGSAPTEARADSGSTLHVPVALNSAGLVGAAALPSPTSHVKPTPSIPEAQTPHTSVYAYCSVVEQRDYRMDGSVETIISWTYNGRGLLERWVDDIDADGKFDQSGRNTYNRNGHLILTELDTDMDGAIDYSIRNVVVDGGVVSSHLDSNNDGVPDWEAFFDYNEGGFMVGQYVDEDVDGTPDDIYHYEYRDGFRVHEDRRTFGDAFVMSRYSFAWADGLMSKRTFDLGADGIDETTTSYSYDDERRLTSLDIDVDGDGISDRQVGYVYNPRGWVVRSNMVERGRVVHTTVNEYDDIGRLTRTQFDGHLGSAENTFKNSCP